MFDFDTVRNRKRTNSLKYDFADQFGYPADVLPLWVADMDFATAPDIIEALEERARHGIFGYSLPDETYAEALHNWFQSRFDYAIRADWIVQVPGVVFGVAQIIQALTQVGDGVLIQEPVYYPFRKMIEANGRKTIVNPLIESSGCYTMDYEDLEAKLATGHVQLIILCSPHNPVGRVWTEDELRRFGDLALRYQVPVVSDEIHQDFVFADHKHRMFSSLDPAYEQISITCTSPSKTFNLAGLQLANLLVPDTGLRNRLRRNLYRAGYDEPNVFGLTACVAAYTKGADWLTAVSDYIYKNYLYLVDAFAEMPFQTRVSELQGTYLAWVDFRPLGLPADELNRKLVQDAKLWLDDGEMFGPAGEGFQRFNLACPRVTLETAMKNIESAFSSD